jgi:hypothetical protein
MPTWRDATMERHKLRLLASEWRIKKLPTNFARKYFREQGRYSISKHALGVGTSTFKFEVVGERLQPGQLTSREPSICPMERTGRGAWLGLDCPRRSMLGKLQQKAPISRAPAE